jgi:glycosyltransferase involved in cell wall biosynthesis
MKILSINKFFYLYGGCERYMFGLNRLLEDAGHQIMHFSMQHPHNEPSPYSDYFVSDVDFFTKKGALGKAKAAGRVIYSWEARRQLAALLEAERPDIAHLHNIAHQLSPSILATLKRYHIPIIQTLHDYKMICPIYTMYQHERVCEKCLHGDYYHVVQYRCNRNSLLASAVNCAEMYLHRWLSSYDLVDLFITPSKFLAAKIAQSGLPSERVRSLSYFVDAERITPQYQHQGYFLFFGQLISVKGVDVLLKAATLAPDVPLIIAGRGTQQEELKQYAKQFNINARFVGFQSGVELEKLIHGAMAVVVPSKWYENQPFAILESFAHGKPVVASRLGGMVELVSEYETGLLFEPGNARSLADQLVWVYQHQDRLPAMGQAARKKIEGEFSPQEHCIAIQNEYHKLLNA